MHARLRDPKSLLIYHQIIKIVPDFPCLADKIVEPRLDMNIKVTALITESKKFYYTSICHFCDVSKQL